jgi:hypothetical protein
VITLGAVIGSGNGFVSPKCVTDRATHENATHRSINYVCLLYYSAGARVLSACPIHSAANVLAIASATAAIPRSASFQSAN